MRLYICVSDSSNCYKHKDHLMSVLFSVLTLWFLSDFWNNFFTFDCSSLAGKKF